MVAIRTVTVTLSTMLGELIERVLSSRVELAIVGRLDDRVELAERLRALAPELVLVGLSTREADAVAAEALASLPAARVLAFTSDGRHAYLHEMQPRRSAFLDVTPEALVQAIAGGEPTGPV